MLAAACVGTGQTFAGFGVQNIVVAAAHIDAEGAGVCFDHVLQTGNAVALRGFGAQRIDEIGVALVKHLFHLFVKRIGIEAGNICHQERADHRHQ